MKKICLIIGSRANYGTSKSILNEAFLHNDVKLEIIANSSAVHDKYGNVVNLMEQDGFIITEKVFSLVEGQGLSPMVKTVALNLMHLSDSLIRIQPDIVITIGDRYETMSNAIAASYMNIPLAHVMGGEVSGTIDESIRHSITKFSHIHFPATKKAAERILKMGEEENRIHVVGCPRIDLIKEYLENDIAPESVMNELKNEGVGDPIELEEDFLLLSFHPVTTEFHQTVNQIGEILFSLNQLEIPVIALWPNSDAGSDSISQALRVWREDAKSKYKKRIYKNLSTLAYAWLMKKTLCQVGNSSSGIREGAFIGTPCVNIGNRQLGREMDKNVINVATESSAISHAIKKQLKHGFYNCSTLYGGGDAGSKIVDILLNTRVEINKRMTY